MAQLPATSLPTAPTHILRNEQSELLSSEGANFESRGLISGDSPFFSAAPSVFEMPVISGENIEVGSPLPAAATSVGDW